MYYDEKIIGGILHWRDEPDGTWKSMSKATMTQKIVDLEAKIEQLKKNIV